MVRSTDQELIAIEKAENMGSTRFRRQRKRKAEEGGRAFIVVSLGQNG